MATTTRDIPVPFLLVYLAGWWSIVAAALVWLTSNGAPGAPEIAWKDAQTFTSTKLAVNMVKPSEDPNSDLVEYEYRWKRNGEPVPELRGSTAGTEFTRKGDTWEVTVVPDDGTRGRWGCSLPWRQCASDAAAATITTTVVNTPPSARARFFEGEKEIGAYEAADVTVVPTCYDPDFLEEDADAKVAGAAPVEGAEVVDKCTYTYAWWPDGAVVEGQEPPFTGPTMAIKDLKKSEVWKVIVVPNDGEADGTPYEHELRRAVE